MKKQLKSIFIIFLFLIYSSFSIQLLKAEESSQSSYAQGIKAFEKFVKEQMILDKAPGVSVGFMKDDFIWIKGFGYADLENRVPAKPESSYRMASITKTFTATAILQLVEAGKIDLDAEVQTYVPYFPRKKWPITVMQLLGHLGGISHYKNHAVENRIKIHKNTKEALAIFQDFDLIAEPGTKYNYSSYGYNLLGAVIEAVSGQSYGDYIKKHIFEPLDMKDSRMDDPADLIPNRARGYRLINMKIKNSEYVDISSRFAAGGTRSTVIDLLKYAKGIIEGKLLKQETWRQMLIPMATRDGYLTGRGMGWRVHPWKGHFQISHGGSQPETKTHILIFPTENFAIAVASNLESFDRLLYVQRMAESVLGEDLDSAIYVSEKEEEPLYDACNDVFSYGMSSFDWHNEPVIENEKDLAKAFFYFNKYVSIRALRRNINKTKDKISAGIHPYSKQAFTKVGSFMASVLEDAYGKDGLQSYHKNGPIAFFSDYIKISKELASGKRDYVFSIRFQKIISRWEKDWEKVYTDYVRRLFIFFDTDFDELSINLKQSFSGAALYPNFHKELARMAQYFLEKNELTKTFNILNLSTELYPNTPDPFSSLATVYLWTGNVEKARELYKKGFAIDPKHPSVSLKYLESHVENLKKTKKIKELFGLAEIIAKLYPKAWEFHRDIGNVFLQIGKKDKALYYFKKALKLNPKLKEVKEKIQQLKKEKNKYKIPITNDQN